MKNQRGITLTSLIIYLILIFIIIVILARVSTYFTSNMNEISKESTAVSEIDKFNMFFIKDTKETNNGIENVSEDGTSITFTNGTTYSYSENQKVIYYENEEDDKKIIIAETVENCKFIKSDEKGKEIITVEIIINEKTYKNEYVMGYENVYKTYQAENNYTNIEEATGFAITTNTEGVVFTKSDGVTPADPYNLQNGDILTYEDYKYTYSTSSKGWAVVVEDKTKEEYGEIAVAAFGKPITNLANAFNGCTNLVESPQIPESATIMTDTFSNCIALLVPPKIPNGVEDMTGTFKECVLLEGEIIINASPTTYTNCFQNAGTQGTGIILKGSSTVLNELAATNTDGRVTVSN